MQPHLQLVLRRLSSLVSKGQGPWTVESLIALAKSVVESVTNKKGDHNPFSWTDKELGHRIGAAQRSRSQ